MEGGAQKGIYVCLSVCLCAWVCTHNHLCLCPCICSAVFVCESVNGILNKQLSISVNRARCMPEAQVAQLQVDTLSCEQKPRPIFLYPNRAVGKETLNVMLVDV